MKDQHERGRFALGAVLSVFAPTGFLMVWYGARTDNIAWTALGGLLAIFGGLGVLAAYWGMCILIYRALKAGDIQ